MDRVKFSPEQLAANRARTLEIESSSRLPPHVARWNQQELRCPACGRHFPAATTRILKVAGQWHCQSCALKMRTTTVLRIQGNAVTKEQHDHLELVELVECVTCHQPFKNRRVVTNVHGHLVHYRCPKKSAPKK